MAGKITSMKNSNENIGNQIRDLSDCIAVPQPTAPPHVRHNENDRNEISKKCVGWI